jgi:site-specific DNA-methyltransferase (adenine-specific)
VNTLFFGDNLWHLKEHIADESIDLVYLDPPFNSQAHYGVFFKTPEGEASEAQAEAFRDAWTWTKETELAFDQIVQSGSAAVPVLDALRQYLREADLMAYLVMMTGRLIELRRVLKSTGSLFLHCDPTASHYLKLVMDGIFEPTNFRNEIIWHRTPRKSLMKRWLPTNHDCILVYAGDNARWNTGAMFAAYDPQNLPAKTLGKYTNVDERGRRYQLDNLINPNQNRPNLTYEFLGVRKVWRWTKERMQAAYEAGLIVQPGPGKVPRFKRYLDEQRGLPLGDVWTDIPPLNSQAHERIGYPTQKPLALLDRILSLASRPGDVVLDPFCGCGTTIESAQRLGRSWVGIDVTHYAISLIESRLRASFPDLEIDIDGRPEDLNAARALAERDPYQFQWWANWMVGVQNYRERKRGPDRGIDGIIFFPNTPHGVGRIVVSVKSGKLKADDIRALTHVRERENAQLGILVTLEDPTSKMKTDAAAMGIVRVQRDPYPRLQIITVEELLKGQKPSLPPAIQLPELERRASRKQFERELTDQLSFTFVFANSAAARTSDVIDHLAPSIVMGSRG